MALTYPVSNNIVVGSGRILWATETSATAEGTSFIYLGDTPGFSISANTTQVTVKSSDAPVAETLVRLTTDVERTGNLLVRNISMTNLALFNMGTSASVSQSATGATQTLSGVVRGRYYKIGTKDVRGMTITATGVKHNTSSGAAYTVSTDYETDLNNGWIYFPTGGTATGNVYIAYTKTATSRTRVQTANTGAAIGTLIFISDNTAGDEVELRISRCELAPSGDSAWKSRENPMELPFVLNVLTRSSSTPQIEINGIPA